MLTQWCKFLIACWPLAVVFVSLSLPVAGQDEPEKPDPPRIVQTQLTLRVYPVQGRATVIGIADETLTILTAAHFLSSDDVGKPVQIQHAGKHHLMGRLLSVTRNPRFRTIRSRTDDTELSFGTMGVDTAIATIKVDLPGDDQRRTFGEIRAADVSPIPVPASPNQILTVAIVDQFGAEHVLRAGNHLNPKCLAWGRRNYDTQRGDSGAGVFVVRKSAEGESWPILIGNVSQTDPEGGIATLTNRSESWFAKALGDLPAPAP
jgi:hypothetical protein